MPKSNPKKKSSKKSPELKALDAQIKVLDDKIWWLSMKVRMGVACVGLCLVAGRVPYYVDNVLTDFRTEHTASHTVVNAGLVFIAIPFLYRYSDTNLNPVIAERDSLLEKRKALLGEKSASKVDEVSVPAKEVTRPNGERTAKKEKAKARATAKAKVDAEKRVDASIVNEAKNASYDTAPALTQYVVHMHDLSLQPEPPRGVVLGVQGPVQPAMETTQDEEALSESSSESTVSQSGKDAEAKSDKAEIPAKQSTSVTTTTGSSGQASGSQTSAPSLAPAAAFHPSNTAQRYFAAASMLFEQLEFSFNAKSHQDIAKLTKARGNLTLAENSEPSGKLLYAIKKLSQGLKKFERIVASSPVKSSNQVASLTS